VTKQLPGHGEFAYGHRKKASVAETLADEIKRRTGEESTFSVLFLFDLLFSTVPCRSPSDGVRLRPKRDHAADSKRDEDQTDF
jgi:hypothetical protein